MACRLVIALNVKRIRDGLQKAWLTHYEARSIVLAKFKSGAVRPFIEKLKRADIFEYFTKPEGGRNDKVFRFTPDAEQRILGELKPLADRNLDVGHRRIGQPLCPGERRLADAADHELSGDRQPGEPHRQRAHAAVGDDPALIPLSVPGL